MLVGTVSTHLCDESSETGDEREKGRSKIVEGEMREWERNNECKRRRMDKREKEGGRIIGQQNTPRSSIYCILIRIYTYIYNIYAYRHIGE